MDVRFQDATKSHSEINQAVESDRPPSVYTWIDAPEDASCQAKVSSAMSAETPKNEAVNSMGAEADCKESQYVPLVESALIFIDYPRAKSLIFSEVRYVGYNRRFVKYALGEKDFLLLKKLDGSCPDDDYDTFCQQVATFEKYNPTHLLSLLQYGICSDEIFKQIRIQVYEFCALYIRGRARDEVMNKHLKTGDLKYDLEKLLKYCGFFCTYEQEFEQIVRQLEKFVRNPTVLNNEVKDQIKEQLGVMCQNGYLAQERVDALWSDAAPLIAVLKSRVQPDCAAWISLLRSAIRELNYLTTFHLYDNGECHVSLFRRNSQHEPFSLTQRAVSALRKKHNVALTR